MDMVITGFRPETSFEVILSPVEGLFTIGWWNSPHTEGCPDYALVATDEKLSAFAIDSRRELTAPVGQVQLQAQIALMLNSEPAKDDEPRRPFKLFFGFGFGAIGAGDVRKPLTIETSMPPCYFLALVHEEVKCYWDGPILSIQSKRGTIRLNERTGALVNHMAPAPGEDGVTFSYSIRRNAFGPRRQQIDVAMEGVQNE